MYTTVPIFIEVSYAHQGIYLIKYSKNTNIVKRL